MNSGASNMDSSKPNGASLPGLARLFLILIGCGLLGFGVWSVFSHNNQAGSVALITFGCLFTYLGVSGDRLQSFGKGYPLKHLERGVQEAKEGVLDVKRTSEKNSNILSSIASRETSQEEKAGEQSAGERTPPDDPINPQPMPAYEIFPIADNTEVYPSPPSPTGPPFPPASSTARQRSEPSQADDILPFPYDTEPPSPPSAGQPADTKPSASIAADTKPSWGDPVNCLKSSDTPDQFLVNGNPIQDRSDEDQLDLTRLGVPVLLVHLAYIDSFPGDSTRKRYSTKNNSDEVIMENTLRWWRCLTPLSESISKVSERPAAILGLVGPPTKRIVISSIELPKSGQYFRDVRGDVEFAPFPSGDPLTFDQAQDEQQLGAYYANLLTHYESLLRLNPELVNFNDWRFRITTTVRFGKTPGEQFVWLRRDGDVIVGGSNTWPVLDTR